MKKTILWWPKAVVKIHRSPGRTLRVLDESILQTDTITLIFPQTPHMQEASHSGFPRIAFAPSGFRKSLTVNDRSGSILCI
jgi:hypothetical protein